MSGLRRNLRLVSLLTVVSRVLGLVRDMALASRFGNGPIFDAFTVAFRLPNLARALLGEGALTTAFLPAFVGTLQRDGEAAARRLAAAVFLTLAVVLVCLVALIELLLWGVGMLVPLSSEAAFLLRLTSILMPYVIFICLAAQLSAILQALGRFFWPALVPIVLNGLWLVALWTIVPQWSDASTQMVVMCGCLVAAGCVQLLVPAAPLVGLGYRFQPQFRETWPQVRLILQQMLPVVVGLSVTQLNNVLDSLVTWTFAAPEQGNQELPWWPGVAYPLQAGTASALYLGQRLYQFPLGVFGVALGTILFPIFSAHAQRNDLAALKQDYALGVRLVLSIGVPASAGLILLAVPLTRLCFERGAFDAVDVQQTATMIAAYGSGVWAYCGLLITQRAFYALGDRRTPLSFGMWALALNITLNLSLIWSLGGMGVALSTTLIAAWQFLATGRALSRRLGGLDGSSIGVTLAKVSLATAVMSLAAVGVAWLLPMVVASRAAAVLVPLVVALATYFGMAVLIGLREPLQLISRRFGHSTLATADTPPQLPPADPPGPSTFSK